MSFFNRVVFSVLGLGFGAGAALGQVLDFDGGCAFELTEEESALVVSAEGGCKERESGLVWSLRHTSSTYAEADALCTGYRSGSWRGWRLPNLAEIRNVVGLGIAPVLGIGHLNDDFFWTQRVASRTDDQVYVFVGSFMDSSDSTTRVSSDIAAVVCVREGTGDENGCALDDDDYFMTAEGGCKHRRSGNVYSPVQSQASRETAIERCIGQGMRLATQDDLRPLVQAETTASQLRGYTRGMGVWVDGEAEVVRDHGRELRFRSGAKYWLHTQRAYYSTFSPVTGRRVARYSLYLWNFAADVAGGRPINPAALRHDPEMAPYAGSLTNYDMSRVLAPYICVQ